MLSYTARASALLQMPALQRARVRAGDPTSRVRPCIDHGFRRGYAAEHGWNRSVSEKAKSLMSLFLLGSVSANAGAQTWGEPPYRGLGWKPDSTIDPALRACQQDALEQAADLLLWLVFDPEVGSLTWLDDFVQLRRNLDQSNIDTYPINEKKPPGARTLADRTTDPLPGQDWYDEWLPKPGNLIRIPPWVLGSTRRRLSLPGQPIH